MYGLIGYPLSHSFSKGYFTDKFRREGIDAVYETFELPSIEDFPKLLKDNPDMRGLNVTIPYKEQVIPYLDELDSVARRIGAVNTVLIKGGKKKGFNTDYIGFIDSLKPLLQPHHTKALILGTGGSSAAVAYSLEQLGISYRYISRFERAGMLTYKQIDERLLDERRVIINTTPLGMYPKVDDAPAIPYEYLTPRHLLFDLIYNPEETLFLQKGRAQGAAVKNGLEMLQLQAEAAWRIWNGQ